MPREMKNLIDVKTISCKAGGVQEIVQPRNPLHHFSNGPTLMHVSGGGGGGAYLKNRDQVVNVGMVGQANSEDTIMDTVSNLRAN